MGPFLPIADINVLSETSCLGSVLELLQCGLWGPEILTTIYLFCKYYGRHLGISGFKLWTTYESPVWKPLTLFALEFV